MPKRLTSPQESERSREKSVETRPEGGSDAARMMQQQPNHLLASLYLSVLLVHLHLSSVLLRGLGRKPEVMLNVRDNLRKDFVVLFAGCNTAIVALNVVAGWDTLLFPH